MKKSVKDYMVIWTDKQQVGLQRWPAQNNLFCKFEMSWGACDAVVAKANFEKRKAMVFIQAMHMIVRDKCDPLLVHKVLMELEEYSDGCSDDMVTFNHAKP